ncbi:MAG: TlpA family protein disulfide reductase [Acidobacteria bacterium]|nr:TlpA family protein disulfide reductase [Acidobacteriota bacterium]
MNRNSRILRLLTYILCCALCAVAFPVHLVEAGPAQYRRPTDLARHLEKEQERLQREFDAEASDPVRGGDRSELWEERRRPLVAIAAERAAAFRAEDWKGDELYALGVILYFGELYDRAISVFRSVIDQNPAPERIGAARLQIAQALYELGRYDDSAKEAEVLKSARLGRYGLIAERAALHRALAFEYREQRRYEAALQQAMAGLNVVLGSASGRMAPPAVREARDIDGARLAALAIALLEAAGRKQEAENLGRRWRLNRAERDPQSEVVFDTEMAASRMTGAPPPGIAARRWFGGEAFDASKAGAGVVLIGFWAMWNSDSVRDLELWRTLGDKYGDRLQVVGVTRLFGRSDREEGMSSAAELERLEAFLREKRIAFPVAVAALDDISNDERFGVAALPMLILVDRSGNVRAVYRGRQSARDLERRLERLLAEG